MFHEQYNGFRRICNSRKIYWGYLSRHFFNILTICGYKFRKKTLLLFSKAHLPVPNLYQLSFLYNIELSLIILSIWFIAYVQYEYTSTLKNMWN